MRAPARSARRAKGGGEGSFTLIEVLVAMTVLAIMTSFIYVGFSTTLTSKVVVEERSELYHEARIVMDRVVDELQSAYLQQDYAQEADGVDSPPVTTGFVGSDTTMESRDYDTLNFTTLAHHLVPLDAVDNNQSSHAEIGYYFEVDYENDKVAMMHREDASLDDDIEAGGVVYILSTNIRRLNFRYYDKSQNTWLDEWNSTDHDPALLPLAVEVSASFGNDSHEIHFTSLVHLRLSERREATTTKDGAEVDFIAPGSREGHICRRCRDAGTMCEKAAEIGCPDGILPQDAETAPGR